MPYFRLTMFGIIDMTCPAALPLVYLSYSDCDLTMPSISWFLATVFTQNNSITLSFSSATVMPYFRLTMFGIIDMTCPRCPVAIQLDFLFYTNCDLSMPSISRDLATVFTQNDSITFRFSSVTVTPYFRLTMFGISDMTCPAALQLVYISFADLCPACLSEFGGSCHRIYSEKSYHIYFL